MQGPCAEVRSGPVHLVKVMPAQAVVGEEFMVELRATAVECVANVVFTDYLPSGFTFVRSEPAAAADGDKLVWKLAKMDAGQTASIRMWVKATKEGSLVNCATVTAEPRACAVVVVGKPALSIRKSGPEMALLGSDVTYTIVVNNTGTSVARNVVVTDAVPDGMGGTPVTVNVGDLAPGQSRSIPVTFKANKTGEVCNVAVANSSNAGKVEAEACTLVQRMGVKITKKNNDKLLLIGRAATYDLARLSQLEQVFGDF